MYIEYTPLEGHLQSILKNPATAAALLAHVEAEEAATQVQADAVENNVAFRNATSGTTVARVANTVPDQAHFTIKTRRFGNTEHKLKATFEEVSNLSEEDDGEYELFDVVDSEEGYQRETAHHPSEHQSTAIEYDYVVANGDQSLDYQTPNNSNNFVIAVEDEDFSYVVTKQPKKGSNPRSRQNQNSRSLQKTSSNAYVPNHLLRPVPPHLQLPTHRKYSPYVSHQTKQAPGPKLLNGKLHEFYPNSEDSDCSSHSSYIYVPRPKRRIRGSSSHHYQNFIAEEEEDFDYIENKTRLNLNNAFPVVNTPNGAVADSQMGIDIVNRLRKLLHLNSGPKYDDSNEGNRKRRCAPDNWVSDAADAHQIKYRKVDNHFPKFINGPLEDDDIDSFPYPKKPRKPLHLQQHHHFENYPPVAMSQRRSIHSTDKSKQRRSMFAPPQTIHRLVRNSTYADIEFSDDDEPELLSNYNIAKKTAKICNIPINYCADESRIVHTGVRPPPPPLIDTTTGSILASTLLPDVIDLRPSYADTLRKTLSGHALGHTTSTPATKKPGADFPRPINTLDDTIHTGSWGSAARSILTQEKESQDREKYQELLKKLVPRIYGTDENTLPATTKATTEARRRSSLLAAAAAAVADQEPSPFDATHASQMTRYEIGFPHQRVPLPRHSVALPRQPVALPRQQIGLPRQPVALPRQQVATPRQQVALPWQQASLPKQRVLPQEQFVILDQTELTPEQISLLKEQTSSPRKGKGESLQRKEESLQRKEESLQRKADSLHRKEETSPRERESLQKEASLKDDALRGDQSARQSDSGALPRVAKDHSRPGELVSPLRKEASRTEQAISPLKKEAPRPGQAMPPLQKEGPRPGQVIPPLQKEAPHPGQVMAPLKRESLRPGQVMAPLKRESLRPGQLIPPLKKEAPRPLQESTQHEHFMLPVNPLSLTGPLYSTPLIELSSTITLDDDVDDIKTINNEFDHHKVYKALTSKQDTILNIDDTTISDIIDLEDEDTFQNIYYSRPVIELSDDEESEKEQINTPIDVEEYLPYVEPVNSLQLQLSASPHLKDDWLKNWEKRWVDKKKERKAEVQKVEKEAEKHTQVRRAAEDEIQERLKNFNFFSPDLVIIDEFPEPAEKKEPEYVELTAEHRDRIKSVMVGPSDQVLIAKFNLNITRRDIYTLLGHNWLNDEVINFYMNLITERGEKRSASDGLPTVYAMNTFFIPRLMQAGHSSVKRWTRKVDIFARDVIPVPVHVGGVHWCMAIIHLKDRSIKYYDSMGTPNPTVLRALEQYLQDESMDKRKQPFDTSQFLIESVAEVPRQLNGSDCGVFSCMFAEYVTRNKEITFTQQQMEYFRQKMMLEILQGELMQ